MQLFFDSEKRPFKLEKENLLMQKNMFFEKRLGKKNTDPAVADENLTDKNILLGTVSFFFDISENKFLLSSDFNQGPMFFFLIATKFKNEFFSRFRFRYGGNISGKRLRKTGKKVKKTLRTRRRR